MSPRMNSTRPGGGGKGGRSLGKKGFPPKQDGKGGVRVFLFREFNSLRFAWLSEHLMFLFLSIHGDHA